jgi:hypothetical protein
MNLASSQPFDRDMMAHIYRVLQYHKFSTVICYSTVNNTFLKSAKVRFIWINLGRAIKNGRFGLLATVLSLWLRGQLQRT